MADKPERILWIRVEGILFRFYEKVTKSWKPKDSTETMKVTLTDMTLNVPQTLEEVGEHSILTALELCQWSIAYKRYLMARELIPKGLSQEVIEAQVNNARVGQRAEMSVSSQITKRVKDADLTPEQQAELLRRTEESIQELLNS